MIRNLYADLRAYERLFAAVALTALLIAPLSVIAEEPDTTAPSASSVSISSSNGMSSSTARIGDTVTLSITASENIQSPAITIGGNTISASGSSTTWSGSHTFSASDTEGPVSFQIVYWDTAGNTSTSTMTTNSSSVVFDKTQPTGTITSSIGPHGTETGFTSMPFTITFTEPVTGFVLEDINVSNGTASNLASSSATVYTFTVTPAAPGSVGVDINGGEYTDNAGNENLASAQFQLIYNSSLPSTPPDTTAPVVTITSGPENGSTVTSTSTVTFQFSVDDASSTVRCFLGDATSTSTDSYECGSPQNFTLPDGSYLFRVSATDTSNNTASSTRTFTMTLATSTATSTATTTPETTPPASSGGGGGGGSGGGGGGGQIVGSGPTSPQGSNGSIIPTTGGGSVIPTVPTTPTLTTPAPTTPTNTTGGTGGVVVTNDGALVAGAATEEPVDTTPVVTPIGMSGNTELGAAAANSGFNLPAWVWFILAALILAGLVWWAVRAAARA
jgi:hypothetical protein